MTFKHVYFDKNNEKSYDVRLYNDYKYDFTRYGVLKLDASGVWVLWTGTSYSDNESGLATNSDEGVSYFKDLEETQNTIKDELIEYKWLDD